jgi:hypothetical protein
MRGGAAKRRIEGRCAHFWRGLPSAEILARPSELASPSGPGRPNAHIPALSRCWPSRCPGPPERRRCDCLPLRSLRTGPRVCVALAPTVGRDLRICEREAAQRSSIRLTRSTGPRLDTRKRPASAVCDHLAQRAHRRRRSYRLCPAWRRGYRLQAGRRHLTDPVRMEGFNPVAVQRARR